MVLTTMKNLRKRRDPRRDLNLIYAISFMDLFAVGMTFPLFSNHLRDLGASHFTVGLISSLYSGIQIIAGPIIGSWSDVRDRKSVMLITLATCSLSYSSLGLTNSITVICLLRAILGVCKHTQTLSKAVIADLLPPEQRAGAFGRASAFGSLGFIAGPLLGGHVSELQNGFSYVCIITGFLFIINFVLAFQMETDGLSQAAKNKNKSNLGNNFVTRIRKEFATSIADFTDMNWRALWDTFLLRFLFGLAISIYFSQQSMYLKEQFNLSQRHIGYIISYFSTIGTIAAFMVHYINDIFYKNDTSCLIRVYHFSMTMTISFVALYFCSSIWTFMVCLVPFSLGSTILRIVTMELMLKKSENSHRGSLSGSSNSIMSVARFITPVLSGGFSDVFGEHSSMLLAAVPALSATIIALIMKNKKLVTKPKIR